MIVKKILNEYGSLVSNLCTDNESLLYITKHTNPKDAIYALSLLIQKRFIEPRKINNTVYYILQTKNIKRRLYFSLYLEFVEKEYGKTYSDSLYKILINGHYKVIDKVTMCKMVNYKLAEYISEPKPKEIKRIKKNDNKTIIDETDVQSEPDFITANYGHIERKMFMNYFIDYIALHYDRNAKTIFESMVDCIPISLKNLTNLLGGSLGDDSYLIEKYILMFKSDKIIEDDFAKDTYRLNIDNITQILKKYVINKYLEVNLDIKAKRIYNLLFEKHYIDDKEIVRFGLFDDKTMKYTLIELYKNGLIQINCVKNNKNGMLWECDFGKTCTMLCNILEGKIVNLIDKLKIDWNVVQTRDVLESDDSVYINDILLLSKMHFILSYDNSSIGLKK